MGSDASPATKRHDPSQRAIRVRVPSCVRRSLKQYGAGHELSPQVSWRMNG
jgi:hypothetical protein